MGSNFSELKDVCPHHNDFERRLQEVKEKFDTLLKELQAANQNMQILITQQQNDKEKLDTLMKEIYGENGNNGLKGKMSKVFGTAKVVGVLAGGGGLVIMLKGVYDLIITISGAG